MNKKIGFLGNMIVLIVKIELNQKFKSWSRTRRGNNSASLGTESGSRTSISGTGVGFISGTEGEARTSTGTRQNEDRGSLED